MSCRQRFGYRAGKENKNPLFKISADLWQIVKRLVQEKRGPATVSVTRNQGEGYITCGEP